jgi:hypothetical protein
MRALTRRRVVVAAVEHRRSDRMEPSDRGTKDRRDPFNSEDEAPHRNDAGESAPRLAQARAWRSQIG